jgi:hypothetical protein
MGPSNYRRRRTRRGQVTALPREARAGLMRAWLAILKERHPDVTWIAREDEPIDGPVDGPVTRTATQGEPVAA